MQKKVAVIIVNWNGVHLLGRCLSSLYKQSDAPPYDIYVVDNGSQDDSIALIKGQFPKTILIALAHNTGFAEGNNIGIRAAFQDGEVGYIVCLNNDTVVDSHFLSALVKQAQLNPSFGSVGAKMLISSMNNHIDTVGIALEPNGTGVNIGYCMRDEGQYDHLKEIFGACAGAALYTRAMLEDIREGDDFFDSKFFAYYEDVDLAWRARVRGWRVAACPYARAYHVGSATAGKNSFLKAFYANRNALFILVKHLPTRCIPSGLAFILKGYLSLWYSKLTGKTVGTMKNKTYKLQGGVGWFRAVGIILRCWFSFLSQFPSLYKKRRRIRARRTVSTKTIKSWFTQFRSTASATCGPNLNKRILTTVLRHTGWLFAGEAFSKGVFFLISIIIARRYGDALFGEFTYAISFAMIFSVLADFGLNLLVIREVARDKVRAEVIISNGLFLKIVLSILTLGCMLLATQVGHISSQVNTLIYILGFYIIFNSYNAFSRAIYRAYERMHFDMLIKFIEGTALLLYVLILSMTSQRLTLLILGFVIVSAITFIVSLRWIIAYFTHVTFQLNAYTLRFLIRESWPFALGGILGTLYFHVDTLMVFWIRGGAETGWYSAAYNFIFAAMLLPSLANISFYPTLSRYAQRIHTMINAIKRHAVYSVLVGLVAILVLGGFAPSIIHSVYGSEYQPSIRALQILSLSLPLIFFSNFIGIVFASLDRQRLNALILCVALLINIILNYVLIERAGYIGASIATLVGALLMAITMTTAFIYFFQKKTLAGSQSEG